MKDKKNIIEELNIRFLESMNNKDFNNALVCINKLLELNPIDFNAYNCRGYLYSKLR